MVRLNEQKIVKVDKSLHEKTIRKPSTRQRDQHAAGAVNKMKSSDDKRGKFDRNRSDATRQHQPNRFKSQLTKANSNDNAIKDWAKFKEEKKQLKLKRKSSRSTYEITKEAKQIYEKLKCRRTGGKDKLVEQIYEILNVGDTISKIVKAHDTARILQCMLKYAAPKLRAELSSKLLPYVVDMCQSKYSHFCVQRMLKYGAPATKNQLVDCLMGHIVRLAKHNIASGLLDNIYLKATPQQRRYMRQEFYGDLYRNAKDAAVQTLSDTYKDSANMKTSIIGCVKANLEHLANKNLIDNSLVHAVMLEYVRACDQENLEEIVTSFAPLVPHMLSTKEGSETAIFCFYNASPKNRRAIIKTIKEHLLKIATHEHGHVFLIALLNALDDTKAIKKSIYDNLHADLKSLAADAYGRRVIQWLVAPGDTSCFHPSFIQSIEEGLTYGKKDKALRRKEIFDQIEGPISEAIVEDPKFWLSNSQIGLVTAVILNHISDENYANVTTALVQVIIDAGWTVSELQTGENANAKKVYDVEAVIAKATMQRKKVIPAAQPDVDSSDDNDEETNSDVSAPKAKMPKLTKPEKEASTTPSISGIEDAGMHHVLKKIIKNDKRREAVSFGMRLVEQLSTDVLKQWVSVNRACYVLLKLVEDMPTSQKCLLSLFNPELRELLLKQKTQGAKLLAEKLGV